METVLITGGSGLIGTSLSQLLINNGYKVRHLSRTAKPLGEIDVFEWDVAKGTIDYDALIGTDYIIHLAGAGIADKIWTKKRKQEILSSRIDSIKLLAEAIEKTQIKLKAFVSTSAIGYYGDQGDKTLTESSAKGHDFLSDVCEQWENTLAPIEAMDIRLAIIRVGIVLSSKGGALVEMSKSLPFHVAGYLGTGKQYYSWIHIDDLCKLYFEALKNTAYHGVYNGVAPNPVTNKVLTESAATAKGITAISMPVPEFALKLAMGEMASMILNSAKVSSKKAEDAGFEFQFTNVLEALKDINARKV